MMSIIPPFEFVIPFLISVPDQGHHQNDEEDDRPQNHHEEVLHRDRRLGAIMILEGTSHKNLLSLHSQQKSV